MAGKHRVAPHPVGPSRVRRLCGGIQRRCWPPARKTAIRQTPSGRTSLCKLAQEQKQQLSTPAPAPPARWKATGNCGCTRPKRRKKSPSRLAAYGTRAPDITVPFRATRMLTAMAAATIPAPRVARHHAQRRHCRPFGEAGDRLLPEARIEWPRWWPCRGRRLASRPPINARGRLRSGAAHFSGHHGQIAPAVVGPQGRDQRQHEAVPAAHRVRQ
jgi:hypothetical protein